MGTRVDDNRNGQVMNVKEDEASIGMPNQINCPYEPLSTGEKMRRGAEAQIFDNNGGESKADGAGVINKNGEYGPVTYGF
jgi:hypothetical protein